jgi:hypothetical protein
MWWIMNKKFKILLTLLFLLWAPFFFVDAQASLIPTSLDSIVPSAIQGFGGKVLAPPVPCTCSGSLMISLFDNRTLKPIQVIFIPFLSRLNQNFNFAIPGNNVLGTYFTADFIGGLHRSALKNAPSVGPLTQAQSASNPATCQVGIPLISCKAVGSPVGIVTPQPFSGMGTSLIPSF